MRRAIVIGFAATLVAASVALASAGRSITPRASSLAQAATRTEQVRTQRYAIDLTIVKNSVHHALHGQSAVAPGVVSVHLMLDDLMRSGDSVVAGSETWGLIDGPFLYEHTPAGLAVGSVQWLRIRIALLAPSHPALQGMRSMTAMPLLQVLDEARAHAVTPDASVFRGSVAYDDPIAVAALQPLMGGLQFRDLRVTAWIGPGGLVRRVLLTGRTPDGRSTLVVKARLFAFGRPVHVTEPAEGTFVDFQLQQLAN